DTATVKGEAIAKALDLSRELVPHPPPSANLVAPLLEEAGVKSWPTFMKKAQFITMEENQHRLKLTPSRNLGPKAGFEPIEQEAIEISVSSPFEEVGAALEKAIALCR